MQIQGQIQSVTPKRSGVSTKNGRNVNWTIYEVTINGQKFDTFDNTYLTMIGQNGTFDYDVVTKVNNGRTFTNNRLSSVNKKPAAGAEAMAKLDQILSNQQEILGLLHSMGQSMPIPETLGNRDWVILMFLIFRFKATSPWWEVPGPGVHPS